jgi:alpha-mannosidase
MFFTIEKLTIRIPEIIAAATRATLTVEGVLTCPAPGPARAAAMAAPPAGDAPGWRPLRMGAPWGLSPGADPDAPPRMLDWGIPADGGSTHWLRANLRVPEAWRGQPVLLALDWQGSGQSSLEAILYLDGQALAGIDEFHRAVLLPAGVHAGEHALLIRCYMPFQQPFGGLTLQLRDDTIFHLGHTMRALLEAAETYRDSDTARHAILEQLNAAYNTLDLREGWHSERFAESARTALAILQPAHEDRGSQHTEARSSILDLRSSNQTSAVKSPTLVATGHAHLDIAWQWPLWRTHQKVAHTVATALHLMERYPDYHFSMSQPHVYTFLQQDDPALYGRLKQRVAEGRFEPVGMMWLEADCNLSSGESLARHLLHGARFFADEFGDAVGVKAPHVVWLPDVFGYSAALPQLLRLCGISCFMTTKISWNQFNRMPCDTFRWRGIDGTEVLTHFVTVTDQPLTHWANPQFYTYNAHMTGGEVYGTWNHYRQQAVNDELLYIYGWGDGGGGPTEEMLESAQVFGGLPGFPQVRLGRVDQFFERLYARVWDDPRLPTWSGELYLEYHRGTYTSQSRTKQANRAAELGYRTAEWLNAWAATLGANSRQAELDAGWKLIMLNQFHDILPGSSVPLVYVESNEQYAKVMRIGQGVSQGAMTAILAQNREPRTENQEQTSSASFVVFNSLPWERQECVQIELAADQALPQLADPEGRPLDTQLIEALDGARALLAETVVPSYGYTTMTTDHRPQTTEAQTSSSGRRSSVVGRRSSLENDELRLELDDNGEIAALYDLRHKRELIGPGSTGNQLVAYEDRPMNWDAWDIDIFYEEKPYPVREIAGWRVVEEGPLRATIEIVRRVGKSTITQRICLWRGSRRVDFVTEVDWQERQMLLRALFPLNINATRATCEIQFGAVERPTHRNTSWDWARFEVCAHKWVDLSEGSYGVALLNDGKYGHSLHHNVLGLSLLKSAIHPDPDADRGRHRFTYSLLPHAGDWRDGQVVRRAYELNAPLLVTTDHRPPTTDDGASRSSVVSRRSSLLSTPTDHIVVETVKMAQDGDGLIVRLYEAHNQRGPASLVFARPIAGAVETDLLEREVGPVTVEGNLLRFDVRPFEIKTLRVRL